MCGFAGVLCAKNGLVNELELQAMANAITHRGPDSQGVWVDDAHGIGLVHQRLAVVDLSQSGHQPMESSCGRFVFAFNGEIYNHLELRKRLEKRSPNWKWRGTSDTETALAMITLDGISRAVSAWTGMFAFALWDRKTTTITLGRDRFGEKPLFAGWQNDRLYIASELHAIAENENFSREINRDALALYFRYHYVPSPHSIYRDIKKIEPGTLWSVSASDKAGTKVAYWSASSQAKHAQSNLFTGDRNEALDSLEMRLLNAVSEQSLADVPLGAFLSGGIDSSLVVALLQKTVDKPVKTYCIGFDNPTFDESKYAAAIAKHLGTEHQTLILTDNEILSTITDVPRKFDEPFADSSQVATLAVSQLARKEVTVCLSGDGGDELFGGYTRYQKTSTAINVRRKFGSFGKLLSSAVLSPKRVQLDATGAVAKSSRWSSVAQGLPPKILRLLVLLQAKNDREVYELMTVFWNDKNRPENEVLVPNANLVKAVERRLQNLGVSENFEPFGLPGGLQMMDIHSYLVDDILCKVDRSAMNVSLETRVPLLNHHVAEYVWGIPSALKYDDSRSKVLLFDLACRHIPKTLLDRPKQGFGVPLTQWLSGPLKEWVESLIAPSELNRHDLLNPVVVSKVWERFLAGDEHLAEHVWSIVSFQAWYVAAFSNDSH